MSFKVDNANKILQQGSCDGIYCGECFAYIDSRCAAKSMRGVPLLSEGGLASTGRNFFQRKLQEYGEIQGIPPDPRFALVVGKKYQVKENGLPMLFVREYAGQLQGINLFWNEAKTSLNTWDQWSPYDKEEYVVVKKVNGEEVGRTLLTEKQKKELGL